MEDRPAKDFVPEFHDAASYSDSKSTGQTASKDGGVSAAFIFAKDQVTMNTIPCCGMTPGTQKQK